MNLRLNAGIVACLIVAAALAPAAPAQAQIPPAKTQIPPAKAANPPAKAQKPPAKAANPLYVDQCTDWEGKKFAIDARIDGCTRTIGSGKYQGKNLAWAYDNRGLAYKATGRKAEAIADFRKAQSIDPTDQVSRNELRKLGG